MTKKDYKLIAKALRNARIVCQGTEGYDAWESVLVELIYQLSHENYMFNSDKFREAALK